LVARGGRLAAADAAALQIGPIREVGPSSTKHLEPWIAANPSDASNVIILASRYLGKLPSGSRRTEPAAWFSADGGATWSPGEFTGIAAMRGERSHFGNAHAAFTADGTAFCVYTGSPEGNRLDLWVVRSDDGGRHWDGPAKISGDLDYPRLTADLVGGNPRVFVTAGVEGKSPVFGAAKKPGYGCAILRSDDGARTFATVNFIAPTTLHHDPINSPLILPNGNLLIGFCDYPTAVTVDEPQEQIEHVRSYATSSSDGGVTFSQPAPICEGLRWDSYTAIAVDRSRGPHRGKIYAISHSQTSRPPGLRVQSSDDGVAWTAPVTVPGLPLGPIAYSTIGVSSQGAIGLAWIQGEAGDEVRTNNKQWLAREHAWTMYVAASLDGGNTFSSPAPLFERAYRTDPSVPRWPYGSEYVSLTASPDGKFHLVWIDTRDQKGPIQTVAFQIRT